MKHLFVTYEIALQLKEKGFDEKCLAYYEQTLDNHPLIITRYEEDLYLKAPLWQQVIDWLRGKCFNIVIFPVNDRTEWFYGINVVTWQACDRSVLYKSYEEAREQAILKAVELCQKEK